MSVVTSQPTAEPRIVCRSKSDTGRVHIMLANLSGSILLSVTIGIRLAEGWIAPHFGRQVGFGIPNLPYVHINVWFAQHLAGCHTNQFGPNPRRDYRSVLHHEPTSCSDWMKRTSWNCAELDKQLNACRDGQDRRAVGQVQASSRARSLRVRVAFAESWWPSTRWRQLPAF